MYTILKNHILPYFGVIDSGKLALVVASLMGGYVLLMTNSPCLEAQSTCQVGSTNEFTGSISVGNTSNGSKGTLDASNLTSDRTFTFPDQDGQFLMGSAFTGNKMIGTSATGSLETVDTYPKTFGGVSDANKYVTLNGTGTEIIANATTIPISAISLTGGSPNALLGVDSLNSTLEYKLLSTIPLEGFDTSSATVGQFLKAGANTGVWQNIDPTVDLSVGTGASGQILQVDSAGTGIEWASAGGGGSVEMIAKGSITGGKVVATVVDGNDLKVEQITALQNSANDTLYSATQTASGYNRYFHYNEHQDRYIECWWNSSSSVFQCKTGSINTITNEITWNTPVNVSAYQNWGSGESLQQSCAYTEESTLPYYMCVVQTQSGNDNFSKILTFNIDSTNPSTINTGETDFQICYGNYSYTYGRCQTGRPIFDKQTNTWVIAHVVQADTGQSGFTNDYGVVVSYNITMNTDYTCNSVNCGMDNNYYRSLKVNSPSGYPSAWDTSRWQGVGDANVLYAKDLNIAYLDDGDTASYEYALFLKPSANNGGYTDAGWSLLHLSRTSGSGAYTVGGTIDHGINDLAVNTGTINQFCSGTTYNWASLQELTYDQGTSDVGMFFGWFCGVSASYGGDGQGRVFGNFFTPNSATNSFNKANTEGIELYNASDSVFGGNIASNNWNLIDRMEIQMKDNFLFLAGSNYFNGSATGVSYYLCQVNFYCPATLVTEFNTAKTDFSPKAFMVFDTGFYGTSFIAKNGDLSDMITYLNSNVSSGQDLSYITPTIDKNRGSWIGYLKNNASDGDTVTVNIISGKATGLTGLTAGTTYYVDGEGGLISSGSSGNKFCLAISQTECLILNKNF